MRRNKVALRLQSSPLEEAKRVAVLRTEDYFQERAGRANLTKAKRILRRVGKGRPPIPGDEL